MSYGPNPNQWAAARAAAGPGRGAMMTAPQPGMPMQRPDMPAGGGQPMAGAMGGMYGQAAAAPPQGGMAGMYGQGGGAPPMMPGQQQQMMARLQQMYQGARPGAVVPQGAMAGGGGMGGMYPGGPPQAPQNGMPAWAQMASQQRGAGAPMTGTFAQQGGGMMGLR